ncbi:MAG: formyltransferase family protein [Campylobacterota bacterium]|nr:formyltransferase family protein [Campylobacterota bacterium]
MKKNLPQIAVLFSGTGTNMAYILEHLHEKELEVAVALTNKPDAKGIAIAKAYSVPVEIIDSKSFQKREDFDVKVVERLHFYRPELTVLAGFMRILTPVFTDHIRAVNLHPSLLPRHKGLKAIEKSYEDDYPTGGVSIHWVSSELDGGEIITQKEIAKEGLSFESYDKMIRTIEKEALAEGIRAALS